MEKIKSPNTDRPAYKKWLFVYTWGMFLIFAACTVSPAFPFHWEAFYKYVYKMLTLALLVLYLYFRRGQDKIEIKLCLAFCAWVAVSRLLNGDIRFTDGEYVINIIAPCLLLPICMILPEDKRSIFLDATAAVVCIFMSFSAVIGIHTAITQRLAVNPFSQWYFAEVSFSNRLYLYANNPNIAGNWMFISIFLLIYEFLKRKNIALHIVIVLMALADYTALALTSSRNAMLGFTLCISLFALLLALKYLPVKKTGLRVSAAVLIMLLIMPLAYKSFDGTRHIISLMESAGTVMEEETASAVDAGETAPAEETFAEAPAEESEENPAETVPTEELTEETEEDSEEKEIYEDNRGFSDSGRLPIYKSALVTIKEEPMRLLRGCLSEDIMAVTDEYLPYPPYGHFHNAYIQVLEYAGIPGLLLMLAFSILLIIRAVKLFFTEDAKASLAVKALILPLPGIFLYNMLETSIFCFMDFRSLSFFMIAGAVLAYSYEICPPKPKTEKE